MVISFFFMYSVNNFLSIFYICIHQDILESVEASIKLEIRSLTYARKKGVRRFVIIFVVGSIFLDLSISVMSNYGEMGVKIIIF